MIPKNFPQFISLLCMYYCNHGTMTYGNYLFLKEFVGDKKELPNESFQTQVINGDRMELSPQKTKALIETYRDMLNISYFDSITAIWRFNGKSANNRAIVDCHTLICDYLLNRGKDELFPFYDTHDWFKILLILRNFASHGWKMNGKQGLKFPDKDKRDLRKKVKLFPDVLKFDTITIKRGQKELPVVTEVNISNLLSHIIGVFIRDENFNPDASRIQNSPTPTV